MLNLKKLLARLSTKADVPKLLDASVVKPRATGLSPTYKTVSAIADYNMIGVRFMIHTVGDIPVDQMLIFPRHVGNWTQSITWYSNSAGVYVRGRVTVEWDTNRVGVALINGDVSRYYCQIQQVAGLAHK